MVSIWNPDTQEAGSHEYEGGLGHGVVFSLSEQNKPNQTYSESYMWGVRQVALPQSEVGQVPRFMCLGCVLLIFSCCDKNHNQGNF